jgi:hypothetical protein
MMKRSNYRLIDVLQMIQLVATSINVVLADLQVWVAILRRSRRAQPETHTPGLSHLRAVGKLEAEVVISAQSFGDLVHFVG